MYQNNFYDDYGFYVIWRQIINAFFLKLIYVILYNFSYLKKIKEINDRPLSPKEIN